MVKSAKICNVFSAYGNNRLKNMNRELSLEFCRVTEAAALAGYHWLGRGDKNSADEAAVKAMRFMLNEVKIDGEIVIGEGETGEAIQR